MSRFCTLFSGSTGNCTYIGASGGGILIDAGVSAKRIEKALLEREIDLTTIKAIFVTHEHTDHIKGLRVFASRAKIPVFASDKTVEAMLLRNDVGESIDLRVFEDSVSVAGMEISRFDTSHDCEGSSGFIVKTPDGRKMAVCTDLGYVSDTVRQSLLGCDLVLLESNHDIMMLQNGPYPYIIKQRILSDSGHLSNVACAAELCGLVRSGTTRIVLGHLSRENNHPELARTTARASLIDGGFKEDIDYILYVAKPSGNKVLVL
ncbi:MAG TPA: MBL fold metallo-hydrolase [Clostridiales bacterium]|nr:MBL fold metallo-hydrolase [Clostridiales bacterium]